MTGNLHRPQARQTSSRRDEYLASLRAALEEGSGLELDAGADGASFLELGLDSLFLTQFSLTLHEKFGVKVSFRQLLDQLCSLDLLAAHLDRTLPASTASAPVMPAAATVAAAAREATAASGVANAFVARAQSTSQDAGSPAPHPRKGVSPSAIQALIDQQLRVMAQQLELLSGQRAAAPTASLAQPVSLTPQVSLTPHADPDSAPQKYDVKKAFGAIARIHLQSQELTPLQDARLQALIRRYCARTRGSKTWTQEHRAQLADPRVVSGFRPALKELVYPLVVERSEGARLWDIDNNEYVDALNGFGSNFFGYQPAFMTAALQEQLARGYEVGPQTRLAGECAQLVCELTGFDRAAFCNTGSEAVMGCMRVARTVTGRRLIAVFSGSYHGIFDEVIVRGTRKLRSIPAAPGIMPSTVENVLVLDYGTDESLQILKARANELAAVLVEPVQSRRPDFQPREFLHEVRALTAASGTALIFDEVITGFRSRLGGAQELFGIRADLASYGKVIGGGLPIGVIAGKREWMDALDGGSWQFGDASAPTVGVTYFAGTFVRHPLAMAACKASLLFLRDQGPSLQLGLNELTSKLAAELNAEFQRSGAPLEVRCFSSLWKVFFTAEQPWGELLFVLLRDRGIHIWDGFPCFLTLAHGDAEVAQIVRAFKDSVAELQDATFLPEPRRKPALDAAVPPQPGARLGRDPGGNPAWYVPDAAEPGKYRKLAT